MKSNKASNKSTKASKPTTTPRERVWRACHMRAELTRSENGKLYFEARQEEPSEVTLKESVERFASIWEYEADGYDFGGSWGAWFGDIAKAL